MSSLTEKKTTPMMEQWNQCKKISKQAVLFFRMGDFYEAFYEDAHILAKECELTLTKRQEVPMSGVPWHTCETYIDKLVSKGYKVAIAEQVEDPKQSQGLVKREVVRLITPGTVVSGTSLGEKSNNFIVGVTQVGSVYGLAACDITTASFFVIEVENLQDLRNELLHLSPSELVVSKKFNDKQNTFLKEFSTVSVQENWLFEHKLTYRYLTDHFKVPHLDGFGLKGMVSAINAAGALLSYIHEELSVPIEHIHQIKPLSIKDTLLLDHTCQRNLELTQLLDVIDHTLTPMGGRLMRQWLRHPLVNVEQIAERQASLEALLTAPQIQERLASKLKGIRDLERLIMRISAGYATPRDLVALRFSLEKIGPLHQALKEINSEQLNGCKNQLIELKNLVQALKNALDDEPPLRLTDGNIFRDGFHAPLDELRNLTRSGKEWLSSYQNKIKAETGIKNLKVSYNKVFGYYIEVSKGQAHLMPESFQRRQTLVNSERFISPILKEYETKVLTAEEQIQTIEQKLFKELIQQVNFYQKEIFQIAKAIAQLDVFISLSHVAKQYNYCKPTVDLSQKLEICEGRHPVVETTADRGTFIPNDTQLESQNERFMLITGPNMAGKSTYIRQVALLVILAQMGSYIPAKSAHIGVIDRIFTRIGANDDLSRGQSTFMVEMSETANILNNITSRSLVILDEIGRGTSTYDGVSIAWAVAEFLLATEAKTLFATHYWELTELEQTIPGAVNYHASVQEWNEEIIFLHKIARGGTDRSYGIHVARLAGLPMSVIQRAGTILKKLETGKEQNPRIKKASNETQLTLF